MKRLDIDRIGLWLLALVALTGAVYLAAHGQPSFLYALLAVVLCFALA